MTKKMISWLAFMSVFSVLLYSCRTDEAIQEQEHQQKEKIAAFERFEKEHSRELTDFKNRYAKGEENTEFSYADPFSSIIYNFIVKHPDFYKQLYDDFGSIDYNVSSQTFGTTNKYILYPILKEGVVTALWYGKINEDRSWVDFYLVNNQSALAQSIISEFQQHYAQHQQTARGESDPPIKDIEEVIITVHTTGEAPIPEVIINTGGYSPPYTGDMSGGPILHGGGGWAPQTPQNNQTPCEKTKSVLNKPNVQAGINNVKAQALSTLSNINAGEIGFKEKKDGTIVPANVSAAHHVIFNDVTDSYGGYHNHTALGTHMFSPPDIDALFGFAAAQSIQDGVGNAYLGMIAAEWCNCPPSNQQFINYVITYTGTGAELGGYTYTTAQMNRFIIDYQKVVSNLTNKSKSGTTYIKNSGDLNEKGLEKLFFETLKIMNLSGKVNLQRIEPNGNIYNVNVDVHGIPVGTPCP